METPLKSDFESSISKKILELAQLGGEIRKAYMYGQKLKALDPNVKIIDLSLGNPDLPPPPEVLDTLKKLTHESELKQHQYMDASGLVETRQFLAEQLSRSEGADISADSVYLTVGAAGALQILFRTFCDPQDEVIIFAPYFPEYVAYLTNINANIVIVPCDENHQPDLEVFKQKLSKKTKFVVINSPNNPSGAIYHKDRVEKLCLLLKEQREKTKNIIHIISDEPYRGLVYDESHLTNFLTCYDYTWVVRSFSKELGLAGERIGYLAYPASINKAYPNMPNLLRNSARILGFVSAPRLMQRLIPYVFHARVDVKIYQQRVDLFVSKLRAAKIDVVAPQAGFFVFPKSPIENEDKFCELLSQEKVLAVPGRAFGVPHYFRVSLTQDIEQISKAADIIVALKEKIVTGDLQAAV